MSAGTTHHDLVPGALFLTRADLDDAILLLGGSERRQGHNIGAEAFDNAGLENLMVSVEAAAFVTAAIMAEIGNRGAGMRGSSQLLSWSRFAQGGSCWSDRRKKTAPLVMLEPMLSA